MSSTVTPVLSLNSAVFTGGASQDGYVLTWKNAGLAYQLLPVTAGAVTLTGDVTGTGTGTVATTIASLAVSKLAAGTANQVLINNATPTPAWTTLSGDVTNVLGVMSCVSITGASGSVPIASTGNIVTWAAATTAPGITQTAAAAGSSGTGTAGATLSITSQAGQQVTTGTATATTGGAGSILNINSGTGGAASSGSSAQGGAGGALNITAGSGGTVSGSASSKNNGAGGALTITAGSGSTGGTSSGNGGALTISAGNGSSGSTSNGNGGNLTLSAGTAGSGAGTAGTAGVVNLSAGGSTQIQITNTQVTLNQGVLQFSSGAGAISINQAANGSGLPGTNLTIKSQNGGSAGSVTGNSGGNIILSTGTLTTPSGGSAVSSGIPGMVDLQIGGNSRLQLAEGAFTSTGPSTYGAYPTTTSLSGLTTIVVSSTAYFPPSGTFVMESVTTNGGATVQSTTVTYTGLTATSFTGCSFAPTTGFISDSFSVSLNGTGSNPATSLLLTSTSQVYTFSQAPIFTASGVGTALTIQAQNSLGTTSTGGNLVLTSGTGTSTKGNVNIQTGGTAAIQATPTQTNITPSNTSTYQYATLSGTKNTQTLTVTNQLAVLNTTSATQTTIFTYTIPNGSVVSITGNWTARLASGPTGFAAGSFRADGYCNATGTAALGALQTIGSNTTTGTTPVGATPIAISAATNVLSIKITAAGTTSTDWQMFLQIQVN